ncbi:type II toxin-antitoxin system VapC family toxin [Thauera linaloolentis]|nr:type II toxin-antitoxin system VapC family toxin [Thauera linaloolentis]MCM8564392.1 type II toxin-antitoxin system VapC family toxin [Thauera linaloolentis]
MLDTSICSFIMREMPASVLQRLAAISAQNHRVVISAITYAEMRYGQIGRKASPRHKTLVDAFVLRLDEILPWDRHAVDAATEVKRTLSQAGTPIGPNDAAIAGHAISSGCILVTNNTCEFCRVPRLIHEDWV